MDRKKNESLEQEKARGKTAWRAKGTTTVGALVFTLVNILTSIYMQKRRGEGKRTDLAIIRWLDLQAPVELWMNSR